MLATANALLVLLVVFLVLATLASMSLIGNSGGNRSSQCWRGHEFTCIHHLFQTIWISATKCIRHGYIRIPIFLWVPVHGAKFFFNPASFGVPLHCSHFPPPGQSFHISARLWPTPPILSVYIMWTFHYIFRTIVFHFNFVMCYRMLYYLMIKKII